MREMKDVKRLLLDGDPAAGDETLSPNQVDVMRRQIIHAARQPDVIRTPWRQPLAVAAMLALTVAAGVIGGQRLSRSDVMSIEAPISAPDDGRRQLQFSTPGGTRIIWVFDPNFTMKETVP
jgi:hypothetical protein